MFRNCLALAIAGLSLGVSPVAMATAQGAQQGADAALPQPAAPVQQLVDDVDIPYQTFTLDNGLQVIVSPDDKAPVVAVSVWYHVGSKDEPKGKTGFAHLFEHLMFGGSENSNQSWFKPMQDIGATDMNGTTYFDRTNYFETVPRGALDTALFLESDRMGHLLPAVTQEKLDIQRGVVQNEKRQGDNQPGGLIDYEIYGTLFPEGHPYHHTTIGSMADLDAASLETVKDWFRNHYGPNNAVLVLAGDIDVPTAKTLVRKYFGDIPRGPQSHPAEASVPTLDAPVHRDFKDQVANTTVSRVWAIPGMTSEDAPALDLAASVLGGLASSRLDNQLVRDEKIAVSVSAGAQQFERVGLFQVNAVVKPGVDPQKVGQRVDRIIADFLKEGPTQAELTRAKTQTVAGTIRGLESVGGFGGKAVTLAQGAIYAGDPGYYKKQLRQKVALTPEQVRQTARKWLSRPVFSYTLSPGERGEYQEAASAVGKPAQIGAPSYYRAPLSSEHPLARKPAHFATPAERAASLRASVAPAPAPQGVDRSHLPEVGTIADLDFPTIERAKLSNGIPVVFAHRGGVPIVRVAMDFDAGAAADPAGKSGLQAFMVTLMDEGTDRYDSAQIAKAKENLGATISVGSNMDRSGVYMTALTPNLAPSLDLMADIVRNPAFRPSDVERVRDQQLARIASEAKQPVGIALRTLPPILYGDGHPYGVPFSGTGDPAVVSKLTPQEIAQFHNAWIRPEKARIYVVGDTTLDQVMPLLESSFGDWKGTGAVPKKDFAAGTPAAQNRVLLIDRPNSPQSLIFGGELLPVQGTDDILPLEQANDILGSSFLSRLNSDLREEKHWAYGVSGFINRVEKQVPYLIYAPVQANQTGPSIAAMTQDINQFLTEKGVTQAELQRTINGSIRELPGQFETAADVLNGLEANARFDRPDDYYETLASRLRALSADELDAAARKVIDTSKLTWVVIGDAASVKPQLEKLGLPVEVQGSAGAGTPE
ncbi:M16 family metallopeptidase [Stakelama saccharophila]|uniref:Pitrilysin family protein n=1 Tax=Stakelama saccharophila TaxID=3075605 RepID=A0ABZ0BB80_9SPHN|nr:pitrilysin family protein [Stakelama sp. W311]WNO54681.1 pitrilysin family protein [Stakelama sp. W311]